MNRKTFIQNGLLQLTPQLFDRSNPLTYPKAVAWLEHLWDQKMTPDGLGSDKKRPPKPNESEYARLEGEDKAAFDLLWTAYGLKKGREGAARSWLAIPNRLEIADDIISAAARDKAEHDNDPPRARKHLQGWLTERRWEDAQMPEKRQQDAHRQRERQMHDLRADISALQALHQANPSESLEASIEQKRAELEELRRNEK